MPRTTSSRLVGAAKAAGPLSTSMVARTSATGFMAPMLHEAGAGLSPSASLAAAGLPGPLERLDPLDRAHVPGDVRDPALGQYLREIRLRLLELLHVEQEVTQVIVRPP